MSLKLVIPAGAKPSAVAYPDREDKPTWIQLAAEFGCDGIEEFGSQWCIDNAIDGLGICTEDSGQKTQAQLDEEAAKLATQVDIHKELAELKTVQAQLLTSLVDKQVLTVQEAVEISAPVEVAPIVEVNP